MRTSRYVPGLPRSARTFCSPSTTTTLRRSSSITTRHLRSESMTCTGRPTREAARAMCRRCRVLRNSHAPSQPAFLPRNSIFRCFAASPWITAASRRCRCSPIPTVAGRGRCCRCKSACCSFRYRRPGAAIGWERALGRAIRAYPSDLKVVIVATGGLSHQVHGERCGFNNPEWDHQFLDLLETDPEALTKLTHAEYAERGGMRRRARSSCG